MKKHLFTCINRIDFFRGLLFRRIFLIIFILSPFLAFAQAPWYDPCSNPQFITTGTTCSNTAATVWNATSTAGIAVYCTVPANAVDVWFAFTAKSANPSINLSAMGTQLDNNPRLQLFSGTCAALTSLTCVAGTNVASLSLTASGLTVGTNYLVRVTTTSTAATAGVIADWNFNICIVDPPPVNDNCAGAILLPTGTSCVTTAGNVYGSTVSAPAIAPCTGTLTYDVWYKFVATSAFNTISLSSINGSFQNPRLQLFSGSCAGLTHVACGTTTSPYTLTPGGAGLTIGNTYFIRVYSGGGSIPTSSSGFNICVTIPVPATVEYSKSYVNITKGQGGGTLAPGDTLEIRATIVVQSQVVDSVSYSDTLFRTKGIRLVPGSIALRTNEGKVYSQFTDAFDTDAGWFVSFGAGPDTAIRMNIGLGASNVAKGKLSSTSKPSFYDVVCIIMATYRVVVYAPYDTKINFGGGAFSFRDAATLTDMVVPFKKDSIMVYQSPGLCPNTVAVTNAIGVESNGTFGAPAGSPPLARNRGTSSYVPNYTYKQFTVSSGPDDYSYGITNNTSARYTTLTTWGKPDGNSPNYREFSKWDISGDHTGAVNSAKGNPPCDTTLPVSATNPCGYMLVINSAYRADSAFQYSVSNLCPNTYYEVSAWIKNICYFCGCDSNGNPANDPAYIPSAPGDSSGIQPNLAFEINGTDYFTTGNIKYKGTTPSGSDSSNQWVKKGFVYRTGPSETSFILGIRNNAPGGGGNDWAIDDISLATCLPNMKYSPSLNPNVCRLNPLTIYDTISSNFNNYVFYKWQRSTNNGATWTDVTIPAGPAPFNISASSPYTYSIPYTIPTSATDTSDSGDRYRMVVGTTLANLSSVNCQSTDGINIINLSVNNCGIPLKIDLLSFKGRLANEHANLSWTTSMENEILRFDVERSSDGINFTTIGSVKSYNNPASESNYYSFVDSASVTRKASYRIVIIDHSNNKKFSRIIQLNRDQSGFGLSNVLNPFSHELSFDVSIDDNRIIEVTLSDIFGKQMKKKTYMAYTGVNDMRIENTETLPSGIYILQIKDKEGMISKKVLKR